MILARAPLRISIGGGGTDMPAYFENNGTIFSSLAINKYVYVGCNHRFFNEIFLRYSENEMVKSICDIKHPIIKKTLERYLPERNDIEITSLADVPSGTGLGSSGSFGVALQLAIRTFCKKRITKGILAEKSTEVEMIELQRPIGLQDQYIASYGGCTEFTVSRDGKVVVDKKFVSTDLEQFIKEKLMLIYVGSIRDSGVILSKQQTDMAKSSFNKTGSYEDIVSMGQDCLTYLIGCDLKCYGQVMHEYWLIKKERQKEQTPQKIIDLYDHLFSEKLISGGKLVGAGGGGFVLVATNRKNKVKDFLQKGKIRFVDFSVDKEGAKLLVN